MLIEPVKNAYISQNSNINKSTQSPDVIANNKQTQDSDNVSKSAQSRFEDNIEISEEGKNAYEDLSEEEKKQIQKLKQTEQEVKAHEQSHLAAAGGIAVSGAEFSYQTGPDGKKYAVGGEVNIDTSKEKDPEDTVRKAQQIRSAAMAPSNPSSTDFKVAAQAAQMLQQAKLELSKQDNSYQKTQDFYNNNESNNIDISA